MIFAGVDWAEAHHDVCVMSEDGRVLEQRRVSHSVAGIGELHALIAAHAEDGEPVAVGIEVDRGLAGRELRQRLSLLRLRQTEALGNLRPGQSLDTQVGQLSFLLVETLAHLVQQFAQQRSPPHQGR